MTPAPQHTPFDYPPELDAIIRLHGRHSLAYSIRQPRVEYFGDIGRGIIACRRWLGQCTVLGDPLCAEEDARDLLSSFVQRYPNALFMQVHRPTAEVLRALEFRITPVGVENEIDTFTFSMAGRSKRDLRHYRNRAVAGGVEVREEADSSELRLRLKPVSDAWLPLKSWYTHELEFLARPFQLDPEPGVRIFVGYIGESPAGFVILDPMFDHGRVLGYTVTILRHLPQAPEGTVDYINLQVIEQLRREEIPLLSLGVSPFYHMREIAREEGKGALPIYGGFLFLERWGSPIYHFRGLNFHKSRYRAQETPVYAAVRGRLGLLPLYASARACRML